MSPRARCGSIVAALTLLSALAVRQARGEEASAPPAAAPIRAEAAASAAPGAPRAASDAMSAAGPLRLVRPLAPETLARVLSEAETLYRARQFEQAAQAYATLLEVDPANAHAWLRAGNLHQHAGRDGDALEAYRNASLTVPSTRAEAEARGKALLNVALLHVASASRAIDELDAMRLAVLDEVRGDVARQVGAQRHRAVRAATRDFDAPRTVRDEASAAGPGQPPRSRRPSVRLGTKGRVAPGGPLAEATASPPDVEVLSGGRGAGRP